MKRLYRDGVAACLRRLLSRWGQGLLLVYMATVPARAFDFPPDGPQRPATSRMLSDARVTAAVERVKQSGISAEDAATLVTRMAASGRGLDEILALLNGLERSVVAGVPPRLMFDKAIEGIAKGVPPSRLVPALNAHSQRLRTAAVYADRLAEKKWASSAMSRENTVLRLAGAMNQGASDQAIERIIDGATRSPRREKLTMPMVVTAVEVYADLLARRVSTQQAAGIVDAGLERGWSVDEFRGTVASIDLLASETAPDQAADTLMKAVKAGRRPSEVVREAQTRGRAREMRHAGPRVGDDRSKNRKGSSTDRPGPRRDRDKSAPPEDN